ncbi:MAG TPA: ABC transporter substrate-binding protein [Xanthobacteraceae bacterium]|jgi:ABC-type nitrate/sulfonate/bicarbonate transport system substrate-binding protein|nr:ABC transporter substrate-binding protein [Xanthobacteraceae bacterium]
MPGPRTHLAAIGLSLLLGVLAAAPAGAAEKLRVGKAVPEAFSFVPLDIGMRKGFFQKYGVEAESIAFAGDARMQQAMASDGIDLALGSGPAMAFIVKGSPIRAIAAMAGPPLLLTLVVRNDDTVRSVADLKGKRVSVSTVGSLTHWLVSETSRQQGWGPEGIVVTPMGATQPQIAALKRREIDGMVTDMSTALTLERSGDVRILMRFGQLVKDFHIHVIFATNKVIAEKPEALRGFLKGWFDTIAFMRRNKAEAVDIAKDVIGKDADITAHTYDELMPMFSDDGKFNPKALAVLAKSYVELKVLPEEPDPRLLTTDAFLPAR